MIRTLAISVRELRLALGWSQDTLASKAVVSQGAISRLESGTITNVPLHTAVVVVQALAKGAGQLGVACKPQTQAMQGFLAPYDGTITEPLDPTFQAMLAMYHSMPPEQQSAIVQFLEAAFGLQAPSKEVA